MSKDNILYAPFSSLLLNQALVHMFLSPLFCDAYSHGRCDKCHDFFIRIVHFFHYYAIKHSGFLEYRIDVNVNAMQKSPATHSHTGDKKKVER